MDQTSEQNNNVEQGGDGASKVLWLVAVLIVIGLLVYVAYSSGFLTQRSVVANVNGESITEQDVEQSVLRSMVALEAQGYDTEDEEIKADLRKQALEVLISQELLVQAAEAENVTVTSEEVESQIELVKGNYESEDDFKAELSRNNFTETDFRSEITLQLTVQKYLDMKVNSSQIVVSDQEISNFYNQLVEQNTSVDEQAIVPTLEEARDLIESQLLQQKIAQQQSIVIENIRSEATIEIVGETETESV